MPSIEIILFKLYKIFEISRYDGKTRFQVVEYVVAKFAEEYAVENIVEGEIDHPVCQMTDILSKKDLVSLQVKREKDR